MKTCSFCGHQEEDEVPYCSECGLDLTFETDRQPQLDDPAESLVVVAEFSDTVEASLARGCLEAAGIEACIPEELDPSPFGNFPPLAHVTVRVAQKNLPAAKEILAAEPAEVLYDV